MFEHERNKFSELVLATAEMYGRKVPSPAAISMYWNALARFPFDAVKDAFSLHIQNPDNGQFMPKPADIVRLIEGDSESRSGWAWASVEKTIRHYGSWESVCFDDPFIHRVIDEMGGWIKLCAVSSDELPFKAKEFERRYRAYVGRDPGEFLSYLPGEAEARNALRGVRVQKPVIIGDKNRALMVYQRGIRLDKRSLATPARIGGGSVADSVVRLISGGAA